MARLLVATTLRSDHPQFDDENRATADALADLGLRPELHPWHTGVDTWLGADLVVVRTTWDYADHLEDFLSWLDILDKAEIPVINPVSFLRWNVDKSYLRDLAAEGVAVVPMRTVPAGSTIGAEDHDRIVKPMVGAGAVGVRLLEAGTECRVDAASIVNPFLPGIALGERSVFFVDGEPVRVFHKMPADGEFRVQTEWGGEYSVEDEPNPHLLAEARRAYEAADRLTGGGLVYLRVDLIADEDGRWRVVEAEGTEPSLYPDTDHGVVVALADAVSKRLPDG